MQLKKDVGIKHCKALGRKFVVYVEVFGTWSLQRHLQPGNIPEKHSSQAKGIWD
jgi:hypothetical protein